MFPINRAMLLILLLTFFSLVSSAPHKSDVSSVTGFPAFSISHSSYPYPSGDPAKPNVSGAPGLPLAPGLPEPPSFEPFLTNTSSHHGPHNVSNPDGNNNSSHQINSTISIKPPICQNGEVCTDWVSSHPLASTTTPNNALGPTLHLRDLPRRQRFILRRLQFHPLRYLLPQWSGRLLLDQKGSGWVQVLREVGFQRLHSCYQCDRVSDEGQGW